MKVLANLKKASKIPTTCSIDNLLDGGVEKGTLTQFYGPPGSGKTNIALNLAVRCAQNGGKVIYVDTEGGISIDRIKQIAGVDFDKIAGQIIVFEPTSFPEQDEVLRRISALIDTKGEKIDLIILDSAVALYRLKDGNSSKLNRDLGIQMSLLSRLARRNDLAVVLTNQIYSVIDEDGNGVIAPVGGTILKYWSKIIVELEKGDIIGERCATLKRHKSKAEGIKTRFRIVERGLGN